MLTFRNMATGLMILVIAVAIITVSGCGSKSLNGEKVVDARMDPEYRGISEFNKKTKMEAPVETEAGPSDEPIIDPSILKSMNDDYKQETKKLIEKEIERGLVNPGYPLADLDEDNGGRGLRGGNNEIAFGKQVTRIEGYISTTATSNSGIIVSKAPAHIKMTAAGKEYILPVNKTFSQCLSGTTTSIVLYAPISEYTYVAQEVRGYAY